MAIYVICACSIYKSIPYIGQNSGGIKLWVNQLFQSFGEKTLWCFNILTYSYFGESGIWLGKILANDIYFVKFTNVFPTKILLYMVLQSVSEITLYKSLWCIPISFTHLQPTGPAQVVIILWAEHCMIFTVTELMKLVLLLVTWWWVHDIIGYSVYYITLFQILAPQEHQPRVRGWLLAAKDDKVG